MFVILLLIFQFPVVNEVMEDPLGPESGSHSPGDCNEYVEIFNPGPDTVDLSLFYLADTREKDYLKAFDDSSILEVYPEVVLSTIVPPDKFALILDQEYGSADSPYRFPYEIKEGTRLITTLDTDLGNGLSSGEPLFLIDKKGDTVSSFGEDVTPEEGVSLERRSISWGSIWLPSRWGTSPGKVNSWSLEREISMINELSMEPEFASPLDSIVIKVKIANLGLSYRNTEKILIRLDDFLDTFEIKGISPLDTQDFSYPLAPLSEGTHNLEMFLLESDDDPEDDTLFASFAVGEAPVVINELMYDDPVEWIELYNCSMESVSLRGFYVEDASGNKSRPISPFSMKPNEFLILTDDSMGFLSRFGDIPLLKIENMPTLNNDKETIFLRDLSGLTLERICYRGKLGGGPGISLERVSTQFDGCSEANWKPSRDTSGATPGRRNSISGGNFDRKKSLSLSHKVFSPLMGQILEVHFKVPFSPSRAKMKIFDVTGRRIVTLNEVRLSTEDGYGIWDGRDKDGRVPPTGLYIFVVEARGEEGHLWKAKKVFTLTRYKHRVSQ